MVMMESTPHLYLSSLPYISNGSLISQQFLPQYPQLLSMDVGQPITLQPEIKDSITQRHPSACPCAIAFSLQGRQIATAFDNGDLWVWDYVTGEIVAKVCPKENPSAVCNVAFSFNGKLVYCCFRDGSILTWEAKTNKVLYGSNERLAPEDCHDCTISPDGHYIAFWHRQNLSFYMGWTPSLYEREILSFYERETCLKLFEDSSEDPGVTYVMSYRGPGSRQTQTHKHTCVMFSPSGSLFGIQQSGDKVLRLWDTQRQTFIPPFVSITESWRLLALSDNYIVACISDSPNSWEVWDIRTRARVRRFKQESASKRRFTFSPDGEYLLRSEGSKCWIWKIESTGESTQRFVEHSDDDEIILSVLSPDSKYIAFSMRTSRTLHVLAWDALAWQEEEGLSNDIEEQEVSLWEYSSKSIKKREVFYSTPSGYCTEAWLKGQHLLWKDQERSFTEKGYLQVFDATRMAGLKLDFQVNFSYWRPVEISPKDNHWSIAYVTDASETGLLCLWNIDEKEVFILDQLDGTVNALAFSATGDCLICGDSTGNIKIWNVRTRQLISQGRSSEAVAALAFSPTGTTFWVAYLTVGKLFIEERECSASQNIINGPFRVMLHDATNHFISITSNNAYICVHSESHAQIRSYHVCLLDCSTGANIHCFNIHAETFARFSPNRRYIAWIPKKDLIIWDLEMGLALDMFPSDGVVMEFAFSNDSTHICMIVSRMGEQHVDIWDIETKGLVRRLFFGDYRLTGTIALYEDSLLWVGAWNTGRIWDSHVHEIMTRVYDDNLDNLDNSLSGMLPGYLQTRRLIDDYKSRSENTEVLDYALVAWNKASFLPWTKLGSDGWVLGPHGELLFWVPQEMRSGLWYPSMTFTTCEKATKLNFDKFVHGMRWTECGKQPKS